MKVVSVVGSEDSGRRALVARLVDKLSGQGRVATVRHPSLTSTTVDDHGIQRGSTSQSTTYGLTDNGLIVTGEKRSLDEVLEDLAPRYEFAVIEGFDTTSFPQVALGNGHVEGDNLISAESASAVPVDTVVTEVIESEPFETLASLVAQAKDSSEAEKAGAIATFTGRVRAKEDDDDDFTEQLQFEQYDAVAAERFATIREELEARDGVFEVLMHHRTGIVEYGDDIVFVVVLAGHRGEAFQTVEDGINRLKDEVPLFKKEITVEDEFWAHES